MTPLLNKGRKRLFYIAAFLLPILIYLIIFRIYGIFPFGDNTVMTGDMRYQFIDYLSYLKTIVFGNNDFNYSFSKNLGGNMAGFSAYYYYSPLNFLTLFIPNVYLPVGEGLVILLTAGLSSLSLACLLKNLYGARLRLLPFPVCYALCGFSTVYFQLTIYSGSLILFPLVILGLYRLVENPKKKWIYFWTLFLTILGNYYSGYMICLFSALFFVYLIIIRKKSMPALQRKEQSHETPQLSLTIRSFIMTSVLAASLTAFRLVPAVLSLRGEKDKLALGWFPNFRITDLFAQFYSGSFKGNVSSCLPNIYCALLPVILFLMYLLNKRIPSRERLFTGGFLGFLILNLWINMLNVIWHGLNVPIGFPYRYSFMVSFFIILFAAKEFMLLTEKGQRMSLIIPGLFLAYSAYLFWRGSESLSRRDVLFNLGVAALVFTVVYFINKNKSNPLNEGSEFARPRKTPENADCTESARTPKSPENSDCTESTHTSKTSESTDLAESIEGAAPKQSRLIIISCALLLAVTALDLAWNLKSVFNSYELSSLTEYGEYLTKVGEKIDEIRDFAAEEDKDPGFYRIEKFYRRSHNDPMQFDYAGLSHFSSSEKKDKINFMGKLGFRNNGNWSFYQEASTKFIDCFFGIRYLLSQHDYMPNNYKMIKREKKNNTFRNEAALPLMFACSSSVRDINYNAYNNNPFALQEALADSLNDRRNGIFREALVSGPETENLIIKDERDYVHYEKKDPSKEAYITYKVKIDTKKNLFIYFDAPHTGYAEILYDDYNGEYNAGAYFSTYRWNIINTEDHKHVTELPIKIRLTGENLDLGNGYFYFEETEALDGLIQELKENPSYLEKIDSSHLTGTVAATQEKSCVLLTIPYDRGWTVLLDGKKTEIYPAAGMLLSFDAPPGEHSVELKYTPEGELPGFILSVVVFVMVICYIRYDLRNISLPS